MLEIDGLCKTYQGYQALKPASFSLSAGQSLGITGENGSGKSTLLRLLAQVERPDRGDVRFHGKSVLGDRSFLRAHLGYVPQQNELMQELTVGRQLKLWQSACGLSGPLRPDVIGLLGLGPMMNKKIRALSGGMRRRVSISMALLNEPDILIMDEATTGLDQEYCLRLMDWLEAFLARGGRLIWCSHHADELERLCGSCLRFAAGQQISEKESV